MSYNCLSYGCSELDDHEYVLCGAVRLGGVPSALFLECDHSITDPSSEAQINAAISAGKAKLVKNVMIGVPAASPIEVPSFIANEPPITVNYDRTLTIKDQNVVAQNISFYNSLWGGRALGGMILFENGDPDDPKVTWIDAAMKGSGSRIIPENNNEQQRFEGTFKWRKLAEGQIYAAPSNIFN
jgi:hypothetical protein